MIYNFSVNSALDKDIKLKKISEYVKFQKQINKKFKVIDVGGGVENKGDISIDCLFDLKNTLKRNSSIKIINKDFCDKDAWSEINDKEYDYAICTHTLEDIRDPKFVISQIIRVAKKGYIAVPHKFRELSYSTHPNHLGYPHHRWIFAFENNKMLILPKSNVVDFLFKKKIISIPQNSKKFLLVNLIRYCYFLYKREKNMLFASREKIESIKYYEYSFEFNDSFNYEIMNDDCFLPPHNDYIDNLRKLINLKDDVE